MLSTHLIKIILNVVYIHSKSRTHHHHLFLNKDLISAKQAKHLSTTRIKETIKHLNGKLPTRRPAMPKCRCEENQKDEIKIKTSVGLLVDSAKKTSLPISNKSRKMVAVRVISIYAWSTVEGCLYFLTAAGLCDQPSG